MQFAIIVALIFEVSIQRIESYPSGAGDQSCGSLIPMHETQAQNSEPPYMIVPSSDRYVPGKPFQIIIRIKDVDSKPFKGFLVQARKSNSEIPVGTWVVRQGARLSQTKSCSNNDDSVTHTSPEEKIKLILTWNPPQRNLGPITIYFTAVQTHDIFWVKISATLQEGVTYPSQRAGSIDTASWPPPARFPIWNQPGNQNTVRPLAKPSNRATPKPNAKVEYEYYDDYETDPTTAPTTNLGTARQNGNTVNDLISATKNIRITNNNNTRKYTSPSRTSFPTSQTLQTLINLASIQSTTAFPLNGLVTLRPNIPMTSIPKTNIPQPKGNISDEYYYYYEDDPQHPQPNSQIRPTGISQRHPQVNSPIRGQGNNQIFPQVNQMSPQTRH